MIIRKNIIVSMVKKEFRQILRDVRMRGVLVGLPVMMLLLLGYAVNTDVKDIPMALFDEDKTFSSRKIVEKFTGSGYFRLEYNLNSEREADPLLDAGSVELFIRIQKGFSEKVKKGDTSSIQIITDGTDSNRAAVIVAYVNEIVFDLFVEKFRGRIRSQIVNRSSAMAVKGSPGGFTMKKGIELRERIFFNPSLVSRNFFLPGVIAFIICLVTIMLTAMSIVRERETGTIEQIIVSPMKPLEFMLGKTIPFAVIAFADMCLVTAISIFWFGVPFNGNFIFLLVSGIFFILSTLAIGLYISTVSKTQQQSMLSTFFFLLPSLIFSGFVFPVYAMPWIMQVFAYINPLMYFITIIRGVFLKGIGIAVLWRDLLVLLAMGVVLIYLSARKFTRRLE